MHEPSNPQTEMKFAIDERLFYYKTLDPLHSDTLSYHQMISMTVVSTVTYFTTV